MKRLFGLIVPAIAAAVSVRAVEPPVPVDGKYVTIKNGHLSYNSRRLRLWGVNVAGLPKRQGKALELSVQRMRDAGFNGIRVNLFDRTFLDGASNSMREVPKTVRGSGSPMDRFDHLMHLAREQGMFLWLSFDISRRFAPGDYDVLPDEGDRDRWLEMARKISVKFLVYIDDRAERAHQEFARSLLEHVNPYTGKRYADEEAIALYEIFNENQFVSRALAKPFEGYAGEIMQRKWNEWLRARYKTDHGLTQAWGKTADGESLEDGTVRFAPTRSGNLVAGAGAQDQYQGKGKKALDYPAARGEDIVRFVCDLHRGHTQRFVAFCRGLGQQGKGVAVVPFTPSGEFGTDLQTYWTASCGDFVSMGVYGFALRPWEVSGDNPFYPFVVRLNGHPMMEQPFDVLRVPGKPYLIYECNDYRPNPYTVEFPARMLALALRHDYDGVFWFNWDDSAYLPKLDSDQDYVKHRLPMPDRSYNNAGLILANDEAALAAIKAAGAVFRGGAAVPPAPKPIDVVFGRDILLDLGHPGLAYRKGGPDLTSLLRPYAWRNGLRTVFDPMGKTCLPKPLGSLEQRVNIGPFVGIDWKSGLGTMRIDAPAAKMQVGFLKPYLYFDGLRITGIDRTWGLIAIVAEDGKPLPESSSILVTAVSRGHNTGLRVDPKRLTAKNVFRDGLPQMIANPGKVPVLVERISAVLHAPWLKGLKAAKFDFTRTCFSRSRLDKTFVVRGSEPLFYARLTRPKPVVVRKVLIIGNSITRHGPSAHLGWNGNWGMAATTRDHDYAHCFFRFLREAQPGKEPQLIIENLLATQLEGAEARFAELARHKADLIIIQIGDNLPLDKANKTTLEEPYEKLLVALKQANPHARIFCLSTWGACQQRNALMKAACQRQGVRWVYISRLIGNVKNRALSEGHFTNSGVNWHPGNRGMTAIANILWDIVKPALHR